MTIQDWLAIGANVAAMLTAGVAVWAFFHFQFSRLIKRKRLEAYLKAEAISDPGAGQRPVLACMVRLRMTENDVIAAAFDSKRISSSSSTREMMGTHPRLMLEYTGDDLPMPDRF